MADVFERLKTAGAGMGTRDPNDYSFMLSVADAVLIQRRIAELERIVYMHCDPTAMPDDDAKIVEAVARDKQR